jgi:hypothetical protein
MCLQCLVDPVAWHDVIPGYSLMKATKPHPDWQKWGLVHINDPSFVWEVDPVKDPNFELDPLDVETYEREVVNDFDYWDAVDIFEQSIKCSPMSGYHLVKACMDAGYVPEADGDRVTAWLFHRLAVAVETKQPSQVNVKPGDKNHSN